MTSPLNTYKISSMISDGTTIQVHKESSHFQPRNKETVHHWQRVLPGRIVDLRYEDLVTDSETGIRQLLTACNLPFHEDCLAFHSTKRSVRTPSTTQVRQPVYMAPSAAGNVTRISCRHCRP